VKKFPWFVTLACLLAGHAGAAFAQPAPSPPKPAWKWTLEERLAARFDAQKQAERNAADVAAGYTGPDDERTTTIVGRTHPELLLPWELFNRLLSSGFSDDAELRDGYRAKVEERAAALGLGAEMWHQLETAAAGFLANRARERDRVRRGLPDPELGLTIEEVMARLPDGECGLRIKAFEKVQAAWGEETTLRLLYEIVAPDSFVTSSKLAVTPERLVFVQRGCR
jgi:hypothetical protein